MGADDFGAFLRKGLAAGGIDARFVAEVSGGSVAIMDSAGDYAATIVSGANLAITLPLGEEIWDGIRRVVLQNEMPEAANLAVAREARARGLPVLLNAAPARALAPELSALVDVLVVNAVEAEMMGGGPVCCLPSVASAAEHLAQTFETVIVTAGAQGLAAWSAEDHAFRLPAEKVEVVSSHGAGDAFIGALAAALAGGQGFEPACAAAAAAARHVAGL